MPPSQSDTERIGEALCALYLTYRPEGVGVWLDGAKRSLGGLSPLTLLIQGRIDDFVGAVAALGDWGE
jgi:hypothetical protein